MIANINIWASLVSAISIFILGGLWYSPVLFGKTWLREAGMDEEKCKKRHSILVFGMSFVFSLIAAIAFALFVGVNPTFKFAIGLGLAVGLGWVATSFGINYMFAGRSIKLFLIDAGYHTLQFLVYGIIFGLWH